MTQENDLNNISHQPDNSQRNLADQIVNHELSEEIKAQISHSVGKLTHKSELPNKQKVTAEGTGFITRIEGTYFVVTAQHLVNLNFNLPPENRTRLKTVGRLLTLTSGGKKSDVQLSDAYYFENEDVALVKIHPNSVPLIEGKAINILEDSRIHSDDGSIHFVGYPESKDNEMQVLSALDNGKPYFSEKKLGGFSGGPVVVMYDRQPQVLTLLTNGREHLIPMKKRHQFIVLPSPNFRSTIKELATLAIKQSNS